MRRHFLRMFERAPLENSGDAGLAERMIADRRVMPRGRATAIMLHASD